MTPDTYLLNGLDLDRWTILAGSTWRPTITNRRTVIAVPGRHGNRSVGLPVYDEATVGLELSPAPQSVSTSGTPDRAGLEALADDLAATLARPGLQLTRRAGGVSRVADVDLVSVAPSTAWRAGQWARLTVLLEIPGTFFRDPTFSTLNVPAGSSSHTVLAGSAPIADAMVRWGPGPMAGPVFSLTDVTTGTGVSSDFPMNQQVHTGWALYVAVGDLRSWTQGTTAESGWGSAASNRVEHVGYPGPGPLQLWPVVRQSGASLVREVHLQSSHPCTIRYRRAWL